MVCMKCAQTREGGAGIVKIDIIIIGAGVTGLACAANLKDKFKDASVVLLERHGAFGQEISSRNSEVIHAGIYYPENSLKAFLCVEGKRLLYTYCKERNVLHEKIGKVILARNEEEVDMLYALKKQGQTNGVLDLKLLDPKKLAELEPNIRAEAALLSPSSGIVDTHMLMQRLEEDALQKGALLGYRHEVTGVEIRKEGLAVKYKDPNGVEDIITSRWLINCAGLNSSRIAGLVGIDIENSGYTIHPCKGEYFSLPYKKSKLVSRLIYPTPMEGLKGLGVHLTKSLDGRLRLGPNAIYSKELDYRVDTSHARDFYQTAQTFLPFLEFEDLVPEMAGVRPKLQGPGEPFRDFVISHESEKGYPGLINLIGIESPGLTCCLSIANMVTEMIEHENQGVSK